MMMAGWMASKIKSIAGSRSIRTSTTLAEELRDVPSLPGSLEESLNALEADHKFLLKGDVFTEDVIELWINYKRKNEVDAVRMRPHPYEFQLYYDI